MSQKRSPRSILCYYCNEEGHTKRDCPKKKSSPATESSGGAALVCFNCNQEGHIKRDCPKKRDNFATEGRGGSTVVCFNCNEEGHFRRDCPKKRDNFSSDYRGSSTVVCYNCNEEGHVKRDCPKKFASDYRGSSTVICYNCNEEGHVKRDCPRKFAADNNRSGSTVCYNCNEPGHIKRNCPKLGDHGGDRFGSRRSPSSPKPLGEDSGGDRSPGFGQDGGVTEESSKKGRRQPLPPFVDTHCHLEYVFERYKHKGSFSDFAKERNYPENFDACIASFCDPAAFSSFGLWSELLAEPESKVWASFGIHPHNAKYYHSQGLEEKILKCMEQERCVAFGEIGLDYGPHSESEPAVQREVFMQQLQLGVSLKKPLVLHCRDAEDDLFKILSSQVPSEWKIHLHCFTGKLDAAFQFIKHYPNLYIGVTGNVTYEKSSNVRAVVQSIPLERLLIETDAPYNIPNNLPRSGQCEFSHPAHAYYVAKEIANLRKMDLGEVLEVVRGNTKMMYGI